LEDLEVVEKDITIFEIREDSSIYVEQSTNFKVLVSETSEVEIDLDLPYTIQGNYVLQNGEKIELEEHELNYFKEIIHESPNS
jgi:hypothetical protein